MFIPFWMFFVLFFIVLKWISDTEKIKLEERDQKRFRNNWKKMDKEERAYYIEARQKERATVPATKVLAVEEVIPLTEEERRKNQENLCAALVLVAILISAPIAVTILF